MRETRYVKSPTEMWNPNIISNYSYIVLRLHYSLSIFSNSRVTCKTQTETWSFYVLPLPFQALNYAQLQASYRKACWIFYRSRTLVQ